MTGALHNLGEPASTYNNRYASSRHSLYRHHAERFIPLTRKHKKIRVLKLPEDICMR